MANLVGLMLLLLISSGPTPFVHASERSGNEPEQAALTSTDKHSLRNLAGKPDCANRECPNFICEAQCICDVWNTQLCQVDPRTYPQPEVPPPDCVGEPCQDFSCDGDCICDIWNTEVCRLDPRLPIPGVQQQVEE